MVLFPNVDFLCTQMYVCHINYGNQVILLKNKFKKISNRCLESKLYCWVLRHFKHCSQVISSLKTTVVHQLCYNMQIGMDFILQWSKRFNNNNKKNKKQKGATHRKSFLIILLFYQSTHNTNTHSQMHTHTPVTVCWSSVHYPDRLMITKQLNNNIKKSELQHFWFAFTLELHNAFLHEHFWVRSSTPFIIKDCTFN